MKLGTKLAMTAALMGVLVLGTAPVRAADAVCAQCGPGDHWTDTCAAGPDTIADQSALIGIDLDLDCITDSTLTLRTCGTDLVVNRGAPVGHNIPTEMVDLCLTGGGGITMIAGAGLGQGGVLAATTGSIDETTDPAIATSTFDVFFEIDLGGGNFAYNQTPLVVSADITCVPPVATYIHPTGCLPLFDAPTGGTLVANLVSARHIVNKKSPDNPNIPTLSEWGVVVMTLVLLAAGTIVFGRIRKRGTAVA